ncbi:Biotin/lipoyl attachment [Venturia nashicola]|uniref:Dihydrolipoamide acetyltransferase component of pyruvate dehydrogenase complex n=1 Tax=Venturia nashicola TaxID=86259 RepID=A0A4Z1P998_9PEZI|nr:Biotin/lipoyl attachment [Venturia nashicola]
MARKPICSSLASVLQNSTRQTLPPRRYKTPHIPRQHIPRSFHSSARLAVVKPYLLADIGEGITECQIIQWFVQPGARVAQFDKICEVQSDKAAVEITSRFDGVIKKLHYEMDDMAKVGKPLVDIDIQSDISLEDEALLKTQEEKPKEKREEHKKEDVKAQELVSRLDRYESKDDQQILEPQTRLSGKHAALATPAVRHLTKELDVDIADIAGSGKDGRVLKEDVQRFATSRDTPTAPAAQTIEPLGEDKAVAFTPIQRKMYETMTKSLSIPHFLYSDTVDFTSLSKVRRAINTHAAASPEEQVKLSALPFIIKAVSISLTAFPSINAHLDTSSDPSKPTFIHKASHNIGFAVDTPQGLIVPVIHNVQSHTISSLATEITRLSTAARTNKLTMADLSSATFSISNIGNIGGTTVAPVIVSPQVAILGVGKARAVPAFAEDGSIVRKEECVFSWSADHRVVDGATLARCAESVREFLEGTERMLVKLR